MKTLRLYSPLLIILLVQLVYELTVCDFNARPFLIVNLIIFIPALFWLIPKKIEGVIGYSIGLLPWIIVANNIQCLTPERVDAAMSYLLVFFYGIPLALIGGIIATMVTKRYRVNTQV